jgi:excisionase family DNA binding protein
MPSYLTTADVAARLDVSLDTVRRWLRSGELKGTPFGRAGYRIEDADFQIFFNQRRRKPAASSSPPAFSPPQHSLPSVTVEDVLNAVGQELRTPLTTMQGVLQQAHRLLQRALESPSPSHEGEPLTKLQDLLMLAERQVNVEIRLAKNLLDVSRIEANTFELSLAWCNLVEIVRETVASHQELAPQRLFEQELLIDDLIAVIADADRIRQALANFLANAHKFSPAEHSIKIRMKVDGAQAWISVQDKGPGIPASEQSKIWERFQQSQRPPGGSGSGLGLGLYITRAIIQKHGGQVGVTSQPGEGSTFWFTLPLADQP